MGFSVSTMVVISVKIRNLSIFQLEMCWTMKVTNYDQMNEENEKMKRDWQDKGGKVNERLETWSVNNKSIIDGSEFTTNISESFKLANKVSTVA